MLSRFAKGLIQQRRFREHDAVGQVLVVGIARKVLCSGIEGVVVTEEETTGLRDVLIPVRQPDDRFAEAEKFFDMEPGAVREGGTPLHKSGRRRAVLIAQRMGEDVGSLEDLSPNPLRLLH